MCKTFILDLCVAEQFSKQKISEFFLFTLYIVSFFWPKTPLMGSQIFSKPNGGIPANRFLVAERNLTSDTICLFVFLSVCPKFCHNLFILHHRGGH